VAISRALTARPKPLLLDEPSLGLAPSIVGDMFDAIRRTNADGLSVLLVEQNIVTAMELARRAYVIEEGRIVMTGPADTLLQQPEIRRISARGVRLLLLVLRSPLTLKLF